MATRIIDIYEPPCDRKDWYGKCAVYVADDGSRALRSYSTIVMTQDADGTFHRHWDEWSATTARHVRRAFGVDTRSWRSMGVERLPGKWRSLQSAFR